MSEYKLTTEIIKRSLSSSWSEARREWKLIEVWESSEVSTCLCGHFPIIEHCLISNTFTGSQVIVGNCCVKKFIGLPSHLIFRGLRRIQKDLDKAMNLSSLEYAYDHGWVNEWEHEFLLDTQRKRNLTEKQQQKRRQVNSKVILAYRNCKH